MRQRAKIVLLAAKGWQNKDLASEVDLDRRQVALWRLRFDGKLLGVVGLYLNPPERALVLSCDKKRQIQALNSPSQSCR